MPRRKRDEAETRPRFLILSSRPRPSKIFWDWYVRKQRIETGSRPRLHACRNELWVWPEIDVTLYHVI